MSSHILVCPFRKDVFTRFEEKTFVIRSDDPNEIASIPQAVRDSNNTLHSVFLTLDTPLSRISSFEEWKGIPLSLQVPEIGDFLEFAKRLHIVQGLNLRVFLPLEKEENYLSLRILSSLCIRTTIVFGGRDIDWETLSDLVTYALLGKVPHAGIEPFHHIAETYAADRRTEIGTVYFDDPSRYLHLDDRGNVSLTSGDLSAGRFIAESISDLPDLENCPAYLERLDTWKDSLLQGADCACCEGWRICLGRFSSRRNHSPGCKRFFTEFIELVEQYQSMREKLGVPCRA